MSGERVLVVDDEPQLRRAPDLVLTGHGYEVAVAGDGEAALAAFAARPADALLLDLMMPRLDGLGVIRRLRGRSPVPIVVLSARGQEADKVAALDLGADDYLTKPFGVPELLARLRAALRRAPPAAPLVAGDVAIDPGRRLVTRGGAPVRLTPVEYAVLAALAADAGRPVTHRRLAAAVWGAFGPTLDEQARQLQLLRVHVTHLRRKLEADPRSPRLILTEPGLGYRLWTGA